MCCFSRVKKKAEEEKKEEKNTQLRSNQVLNKRVNTLIQSRRGTHTEREGGVRIKEGHSESQTISISEEVTERKRERGGEGERERRICLTHTFA